METDDRYTRITLRIPKDLHARLAKAAEETSKSMNAEIIARLELSMFKDTPALELVPAGKAKELSAFARQGIPALVQERIVSGINRAVMLGHSSASIDLRDLELELLPEDDSEALFNAFERQLEDAGYRVEWDGGESIWIEF